MRTLIFLLLFTSLSARAAEDDSTKAYDFLNQVTSQIAAKRADTSVCYIVDTSRFFLFGERLSITDSFYTQKDKKVASPISKRDSADIMSAIINPKKACFNAQRLNSAVVISSEQLIALKNKVGWAEMLKQLNIKHGYFYMSFPIFFDNGNKALFFCDYRCGGLCGGGSISIYEDIKGVWTRTILLSGWEY